MPSSECLSVLGGVADQTALDRMDEFGSRLIGHSPPPRVFHLHFVHRLLDPNPPHRMLCAFFLCVLVTVVLAKEVDLKSSLQKH
ncbi:MAG: hypothetical protein WKF41_13775 [Gaiellaceae bacterium]